MSGAPRRGCASSRPSVSSVSIRPTAQLKAGMKFTATPFWGCRTSPRLPCPSVSLLAQSAGDCPTSIGLLAHRAGGAGLLTADDDGLLDDAARLAARISEGPYDSHALRVRHRCRVHRLWTP